MPTTSRAVLEELQHDGSGALVRLPKYKGKAAAKSPRNWKNAERLQQTHKKKLSKLLEYDKDTQKPCKMKLLELLRPSSSVTHSDTL